MLPHVNECSMYHALRLRAPRRAGSPRGWKDGKYPLGSRNCPPSKEASYRAMPGPSFGYEGHFKCFPAIPATGWHDTNLSCCQMAWAPWKEWHKRWGLAGILPSEGVGQDTRRDVVSCGSFIKREHPLLYLQQPIFPVLHPSAKIPGSHFPQIVAP